MEIPFVDQNAFIHFKYNTYVTVALYKERKNYCSVVFIYCRGIDRGWLPYSIDVAITPSSYRTTWLTLDFIRENEKDLRAKTWEYGRGF